MVCSIRYYRPGEREDAGCLIIANQSEVAAYKARLKASGYVVLETLVTPLPALLSAKSGYFHTVLQLFAEGPHPAFRLQRVFSFDQQAPVDAPNMRGAYWLVRSGNAQPGADVIARLNLG